jgi:large subunit ribosomal protein L21
MKYAIVRTGGKQYQVQEGEELLVELLSDDSKKIELETLLRVDGEQVEIGSPVLEKSTKVEIVADEKGPKKVGMKYIPKGYRRKFGHRQKYSKIKILEL